MTACPACSRRWEGPEGEACPWCALAALAQAPDLTPKHEDCKHTVDCRECDAEPAVEWPSEKDCLRLLESFGAVVCEGLEGDPEDLAATVENVRAIRSWLASLPPSPTLCATADHVVSSRSDAIDADYHRRKAEAERDAALAKLAALRQATQELVNAIEKAQDWSGTRVGDALLDTYPLLAEEVETK